MMAATRVTEDLLMLVIDVVEGPPTNDQISNILEYLGAAKAGSVVSGASDISDALRKFKDSENAFQRPIVVDWNNGRAGTLLSTDREVDHILTQC